MRLVCGNSLPASLVEMKSCDCISHVFVAERDDLIHISVVKPHVFMVLNLFKSFFDFLLYHGIHRDDSDNCLIFFKYTIREDLFKVSLISFLTLTESEDY